jgi:thymidylate synthase
LSQLIRIEDNRSGYRNLVNFVLMHGIRQPSRNGNTLEVSDMVVELADPTKSLPSGIGRRGYSNALAALEGLQLVAGQTYDDLMVKIAPNTEQFREDDGKFHGGYGRRIGEQMQAIVERLRDDHDTRQAVVTIWDPALDTEPGKRDYPCTVTFNWRIRDNKLLMTTFMRSQDIHWGWPYDVVMFSCLQLAMASYLGVGVGTYTHHSASFHAYEKDVQALKSTTPYNGEDLRLPVISTDDCDTWEKVQNRARLIVASAEANEELATLKYGERWYYDVIRKRLHGE